jgi:hypothetical protein
LYTERAPLPEGNGSGPGKVAAAKKL